LFGDEFLADITFILKHNEDVEYDGGHTQQEAHYCR